MSDIEKAKTFEDRLKERIKDSIGELMTDEDLSKIVHRSMEEVFFKPRLINSGNAWKDPIEKPPVIHELIKELLEEKVRSEIDKYLNNHKEDVRDTIKKHIEQGILQAAGQALNRLLSNATYQLEQNILNDLRLN